MVVTFLIGLPGAGKSTYAPNGAKRICPDEIRKQLYGDISVQGDPKEELLDYLVDKIYVSSDKLTVVMFYSGYIRELPYKDTVNMINNKTKLFTRDTPLTPEQENLMQTMLESAAYPGFGDEGGTKDEDNDFFQ